MQRLLGELEPGYAEEPIYQVLERVFGEHFIVAEERPRPKAGLELSASSMQSPDDLEATYREKGKRFYKGYVVNLMETCDPENELHLITKVLVAPNNTEDADLLVEALPGLKARTELNTLHTDGGFGSPDADEALREAQVKLIQTAIRGRDPRTDRLHLADFEIQSDQQGVPTRVICPRGQTVKVSPGRKPQRYVARFEASQCQECLFYQEDRCLAQTRKRHPSLNLYFS